MKYMKAMAAVLVAVFLCSFAADWIDFASKEGRFKIKFPRKPEPSTKNVSADKTPLKMHMFVYDASKYKDDNLAYYLMYCDYPRNLVSSDFRDEIVDTILQSSLTGAAANMDGKVISITKIGYHEFPGKNAKFDVLDGKGMCYMNIYLVHSRMYLLMAMCEPKNDSNASLQKFFGSFVITDMKRP